jgi:long-chain-fatty-acid--[acyl-carrier-protein] ligase
MKKLIFTLLSGFLKTILWFRYKVKVEGLDKLNSETLNKPGGVLFLPNHPSIFVDPVVVSLAVFKKYPLRPMITDYMYYNPVINKIARLLNGLPVPNFHTSSNSLKKKKNDKVFKEVIDGLNEKKENFLVYPAGKTKNTGMEIIGGASGTHKIVQEAPNVNVVLVRTKGLWGSSFSRAFTNASPPMFPTIWDGVKHVLKNLLLFTPRRQITITFEPAPADFPYKSSRMEFNKYLEAWYNQADGLNKENPKAPGDSLVLIPKSIWSNQLPVVPNFDAPKEDDVDLESIPPEVQQKVKAKLSEMAEMDPKSIKPGMNLSTDLGLDSLDMAELIVFLSEQFEVTGVTVPDLTTVNKLMAYAGKIIVIKEAPEVHAAVPAKWQFKGTRKRVKVTEGKTIPEVFLNTCKKMGKKPAVGDDRSGIMTFADMKLRSILLAEYIRTLPGDYIGILLPSSSMTTLLIFAVQLAGKVPLMVNWTVGSRHLESVVQLSNVEVVLTSWAFLDRLENVDLNGIEEKLLMLEDVKPLFGLKQKLKALWRSKQSTKTIMKKFGLKNDPDGKAVLLFTSGTESMPKGVPLSHNNILSNQRSAADDIEFFNDDVFLAILPPFHSYGFTASSLLGPLSGFKTAFYPNPTDGKGVASAFERWGATIVCGAPTFVKNMLKAAKPEQLHNMRLCVTGAEKAPPELFYLIDKIGRGHILIEGYGITECSPALTANRPGKPNVGVGQPLSCVELIIVHPETQQILPKDTQGMILVRGPNIFSGYINPGISSPFVTVDGKEWYKTGDLGYLDANNNLTISGRMKRFVKIGGEMVSLGSVESALSHYAASNHWPVSDEEGPTIAVCAKEGEGEKTKLYLFTRFDVSLEEVNKALKESGFSNLVKISNVYKLDEIPLMGTGKINYRVLESQIK